MLRRFIVLLAAVVAATTGCASGGGEAGAKKIVTPVRVRQVEEQSEPAAARYSGTVEPGTRVDLAFKVSGYIRDLAQVKIKGAPARKVQEGDFVKKGTVLAVVRESDYGQRVHTAVAANAEANAAVRQAELDFARAQKLGAEALITTSDLEMQGAALATASARVDASGSRVREAQLALADCVLRAPIDGVVLKRPVEVGSLVGPGTLGFVIADTKTVKVIFGAPDRLMEKLRVGGALSVTFDSPPGDFTGTITRIAPSADIKSRVFEIEATIPNSNDQLKVGMIAKLVVPAEALTSKTLVLPLTAVVRSPRDPRGFSVFVVEGPEESTIARLRDVKLGDIVGNAVVVSEGLDLAHRVVSMGATLLTDGEPVRVIP